MIEAFGITDVGRRRKVNEDAFVQDDGRGFYAVCDGMGGHNAGEVASRMSVDTMASFIDMTHEQALEDIAWPFGAEPGYTLDANRLRSAIRLANARVSQSSHEREDYAGMGTTVVALLTNGSTATVAWAGDSRCYLMRDGVLSLLTRDDSWVSAACSEGILSAEEIERHPMRNIITKAIGAGETIEPAIEEAQLAPGDCLLLCTDGLHAMISDEAIHRVWSSAAGIEEAGIRLIDAANEAGGRDNVTVVLLRRS